MSQFSAAAWQRITFKISCIMKQKILITALLLAGLCSAGFSQAATPVTTQGQLQQRVHVDNTRPKDRSTKHEKSKTGKERNGIFRHKQSKADAPANPKERKELRKNGNKVHRDMKGKKQ